MAGVPRVADPALAERIVDVAAHLLATEGRAAVTARRLAREVQASTMAVYTHFGSMDDVQRHVMRRGFRVFLAELTRGRSSADPVADWMAQGWAYRRFARREPELYTVMFGEGLGSFKRDDPADQEAAMATFLALLERIQACVDAGRWTVDDLPSAGEVVWAASHGLVSIEVTGYFEAVGRDAEAAWGEVMTRLAVGFGDDPAAAAASLRVATRRARTVDGRERQAR